MLAECLEAPPIASACPRVVPRTAAPYRGGAIDFGTGRFAAVDLRSGAPDEDRYERNAPPRFAHVVVEGGDVVVFRRLAAAAESLDVRPPTEGLLEDVDSVLQRERRRPVALGDAVWGGRRGSLLLFPGYPVGGSSAATGAMRLRTPAAAAGSPLHLQRGDVGGEPRPAPEVEGALSHAKADP